MIYQATQQWGRRASLEIIYLMREYLEKKVETNINSKFYNTPYYTIKASAFEKMNQLGLGGQATVRKECHHLMKAYDDPKDPFCLFKNIDYQINHCLPKDWKSFLFLHAAPQKAKDYAARNGIEVVDAGVYKLSIKKYLCINPKNPAGKLGVKFPNTAMTRFGLSCEFENKMTGRSGRRTTGAKTGKAKANDATKKAILRHKVDTTARYSDDNDIESWDAVLESLKCPVEVLKKYSFYIPKKYCRETGESY